MTDFSKGYKAKITPDGGEAFDATIEYYHPDISPPGEQPEPPEPEQPPVIVIPPVPSPIPEPIPEPPAVVGSAKLILTLSQDGWKWLVIPPPAQPKPPGVPIPKDEESSRSRR